MRSVIDLKAIKYASTQPLSRNKKGLLVQKPYIEIIEGDDIYYLYGKDVMWSYLDALFYKDPLPRAVVEDDIFAPTTNSPSLYSLLHEFTIESVNEGNRYIEVEHDKRNRVNMFASLNDSAKNFDDILKIQNMLKDYKTYSMPSLYKNKQGNHIRPSLVCWVSAGVIIVFDLGNSYYFAARGTDTDGNKIGLCEPTTVKKKDDVGLFTTVKNLTELCNKYSMMWFPKGIGEVVKPNDFTTREYDILLHQRLGVRI